MKAEFVIPEIRKHLKDISHSHPKTSWEAVLMQYNKIKKDFPEILVEFYGMRTNDQVYPIMLLNRMGIFYYAEAFNTVLAGLWKHRNKEMLLNWACARLAECYGWIVRDIIKLDDTILRSPTDYRLFTKYQKGIIPQINHKIQPPIEGTATVEIKVTNIIPDKSDIRFFHDIRGNVNSVISVGKTNARLRAEGFVLRGNDIYIGFRGDKYKIPGGAIDPDESYEDGVMREIREEALIISGNPRILGAYIEVRDEPEEWMQQKLDKKVWTTVRYTIVYLVDYIKEYKGYVSPQDRDSLVTYGRFYPLNSVIEKLTDVHRQLLMKKEAKP